MNYIPILFAYILHLNCSHIVLKIKLVGGGLNSGVLNEEFLKI